MSGVISQDLVLKIYSPSCLIRSSNQSFNNNKRDPAKTNILQEVCMWMMPMLLQVNQISDYDIMMIPYI